MITTNPVGSKEKREELRRLCGREKSCNPRLEFIKVPLSAHDAALDGLDIAEEMVALLHTRGHTGEEANATRQWKCKYCRWLAKYDTWKGER